MIEKNFDKNQDIFATGQQYVQKFTITYCLIILTFSAYFTPQDFNLKVSVIVNTLFFLIGAPYWFRKSKISPYHLNIISQVSNALASVWTCSFLGPTSNINMVAIPQFVLVLMMFGGKPKTKYILGTVCIVLLLLPLFPFVNQWYLDKRMKEENLVILRAFIDLAILAMSAYQFKVIVENWRDALLEVEEDKLKLHAESMWRHRLLNILSHDIKEPMVYTLQFLRKLKKEEMSESDKRTISQIENAQMVIREVISNVESFSSFDFELDLPKNLMTLEDVMIKTMPWLKSRLDEKSIEIRILGDRKLHALMVYPDAFAYQIFNNLMTNAIKFSPRNSVIEISTTKIDNGKIQWMIRDYGPGIKKEAIGDDIYSENGSEGESGSGLGIRIAKTFAHKQGIEIEWMSKFTNPSHEEVGTTIFLNQKLP
jgi:signal transduction histidine kinase